MKKALITLLVFLSLPLGATPSSNLWAPSTALCQAYATPHLTYDTYVRKTAGYANDYGLTVGVLPFDQVQAEVGWDMLLPSESPHLLNGKFCLKEPSLSFGIYNVGFEKNVTDANILYVMYQHRLSARGGSFAIGGYHGTNKVIFTNSDGDVRTDGVLLAIVSPDVELGFKNLPKMNVLFDLQTGRNIYGAWAVGANFFFADHVSLLVGPAFFFDRQLQPEGADSLWAVELDVDL